MYAYVALSAAAKKTPGALCLIPGISHNQTRWAEFKYTLDSSQHFRLNALMNMPGPPTVALVMAAGNAVPFVLGSKTVSRLVVYLSELTNPNRSLS